MLALIYLWEAITRARKILTTPGRGFGPGMFRRRGAHAFDGMKKTALTTRGHMAAKCEGVRGGSEMLASQAHATVTRGARCAQRCERLAAWDPHVIDKAGVRGVKHWTSGPTGQCPSARERRGGADGPPEDRK